MQVENDKTRITTMVSLKPVAKKLLLQEKEKTGVPLSTQLNFMILEKLGEKNAK